MTVESFGGDRLLGAPGRGVDDLRPGATLFVTCPGPLAPPFDSLDAGEDNSVFRAGPTGRVCQARTGTSATEVTRERATVSVSESVRTRSNP
ncbi:hypothetical protein [Haloarcula rubra]|uniref:hypothetical protein n=1 Tax=Haloarcula rubra TaxID=2487747 RepID=UPI001C737110|nr:hypothetical protein [Halomicroarcula rubra]